NEARPVQETERRVKSDGPGSSPGRRFARRTARTFGAYGTSMTPREGTRPVCSLPFHAEPVTLPGLFQQAATRTREGASDGKSPGLPHEQPGVSADSSERLPRRVHMRLRQGDQVLASGLRHWESSALRRVHSAESLAASQKAISQ